MNTSSPATRCQYLYDPLDRLASRAPDGQASGRCFYRNNRLSSEIQGLRTRAWLQTPQHLLALLGQDTGRQQCVLITTDTQGSVLHGMSASARQPCVYTTYGYRSPFPAPLGVLGFNCERTDPFTGHYLLGNGYRAFNPVLMRFNSPDDESPFGEGGLNAYAYCSGDPVNRTDPDGHVRVFIGKAPDHLTFKHMLRSRGKTRPSPLQDITTSRSLEGLPGSLAIPDTRNEKADLGKATSMLLPDTSQPGSSHSESPIPGAVPANQQKAPVLDRTLGSLQIRQAPAGNQTNPAPAQGHAAVRTRS